MGAYHDSMERLRQLPVDTTGPKIVTCKIEGDGVGGASTCVYATFEDGTNKLLFIFFSDELTFTEQEFVGLTEAQAHALHYQRDLAYLQS